MVQHMESRKPPQGTMKRHTKKDGGAAYRADVKHARQTRREQLQSEMKGIEDELELIGDVDPGMEAESFENGHPVMMAMSPFAVGSMSWFPGTILATDEIESRRLEEEMGCPGVIFVCVVQLYGSETGCIEAWWLPAVSCQLVYRPNKTTKFGANLQHSQGEAHRRVVQHFAAQVGCRIPGAIQPLTDAQKGQWIVEDASFEVFERLAEIRNGTSQDGRSWSQQTVISDVIENIHDLINRLNTERGADLLCAMCDGPLTEQDFDERVATNCVHQHNRVCLDGLHRLKVWDKVLNVCADPNCGHRRYDPHATRYCTLACLKYHEARKGEGAKK